MAEPSAAVIVLDHRPSDEEIEDLAYAHLDEFGADQATASFEILSGAPDWMNVCEQDQINAHMRDSSGSVVLVIYMVEGEFSDDEED